LSFENQKKKIVFQLKHKLKIKRKTVRPSCGDDHHEKDVMDDGKGSEREIGEPRSSKRASGDHNRTQPA
jgi:hypothetical protein